MGTHKLTCPYCGTEYSYGPRGKVQRKMGEAMQKLINIQKQIKNNDAERIRLEQVLKKQEFLLHENKIAEEVE